MWKWLVLALFLPLSALAEGLPKPVSDTVNDFGDLLSPEAEARLTTALKKARVESKVHVVLVTMDRREDFGGEGRSIEDYALALFNDWGVGDRKRNDGVMILVARTDREMRIQLGSGFGSEWDGVAQGVIDRDFLPSFRRDDYEGGIEAGAAAVIARIARPFGSGQTAPVYTAPAPAVSPQGPEGGSGGFAEFLMIPFILLVGGVLALRQVIADYLVSTRPCPKCGKKGLSRSRQVLSSATHYSTGSGRMTTRCQFCDYMDVQDYTIPRLRDTNSSGGGSSGFGGGRSSGGGASGRW